MYECDDLCLAHHTIRLVHLRVLPPLWRYPRPSHLTPRRARVRVRGSSAIGALHAVARTYIPIREKYMTHAPCRPPAHAYLWFAIRVGQGKSPVIFAVLFIDTSSRPAVRVRGSVDTRVARSTLAVSVRVSTQVACLPRQPHARGGAHRPTTPCASCSDRSGCIRPLSTSITDKPSLDVVSAQHRRASSSWRHFQKSTSRVAVSHQQKHTHTHTHVETQPYMGVPGVTTRLRLPCRLACVQCRREKETLKRLCIAGCL